MNDLDLLDLTFFRGRVGLCKILQSLNIKAGDEVITQAFTCVAVPEGILASGGTPVYVDIEATGYTLDPAALERAINERTRALIVQHTFGIPANMEPILEIGKKHNLIIIEDCCHTVSSQYSGTTVGTFGDAAFYSFEYGKPYAIGAGGSVVANNAEIRKRLERLSSLLEFPTLATQLKIELQFLVFHYAYTPALYWFLKRNFHKLTRFGILKGNYNTISADTVSEEFHWRMGGLAKRRLSLLLKHRKEPNRLEAAYQSAFRHLNIRLPKVRQTDRADFIRFPIQVPNKKGLLETAQHSRVEVADWYRTPIHPLADGELLKVKYVPGSCPNAEQRAAETVSLPMHHSISRSYLSKLTTILENCC